MREKGIRLAILLFFFIGLANCQTRHAVELAPVEIKPIHITIDVNVRVDRALDNFFDDIDSSGKKIQGLKEGKH
jgi:hypothetical protein